MRLAGLEDIGRARRQARVQRKAGRGNYTTNFRERQGNMAAALTDNGLEIFLKNMVIDGVMSWLKLSREYDPILSIDRTVAYQRIMDPQPSKTKDKAGLQLPIWQTNVDECETRYQMKLDTLSKMTASKILIKRGHGRKVHWSRIRTGWNCTPGDAQHSSTTPFWTLRCPTGQWQWN